MSLRDIGGRPVDLESLSSGEQHELVLLYDLLFKTKKDTLLLVDEPEISLHIAWQKQFLSDLRRIIALPRWTLFCQHTHRNLLGATWIWLSNCRDLPMPSRIEDEINPNIVAAEVVMLRAASNNTILILEGPSDERVFVNFIDAGQCEIVIAHGKHNAVEAIALLKSRSLTGLLCIVDQDFDHLLGNSPSAKDVLKPMITT